jgi:dsDNA-binding SOS-regulon protein
VNACNLFRKHLLYIKTVTYRSITTLPRNQAGEIMAVVVKYVVERNGVERMTFTTKKEADAYDKMLDIAESLEVMLEKVDVPLSEQQVESLALEIAKSKDDFMAVLKGAKEPTTKSTAKAKKADNVASIKDSDEQQAS